MIKHSNRDGTKKNKIYICLFGGGRGGGLRRYMNKITTNVGFLKVGAWNPVCFLVISFLTRVQWLPFFAAFSPVFQPYLGRISTRKFLLSRERQWKVLIMFSCFIFSQWSSRRQTKWSGIFRPCFLTSRSLNSLSSFMLPSPSTTSASSAFFCLQIFLLQVFY